MREKLITLKKACTDQFSSRLPLKECAQRIYALAKDANVRGVLNVGTPARWSKLAWVSRILLNFH